MRLGAVMRRGKMKGDSRVRTRLGLELERSSREILVHGRGEIKLPMRRVVVPDDLRRKRRVR